MSDSENTLSNRLRAAAAVLTEGARDPAAGDLLRYLGYDDGDATASAGRARMLRAGADFRRLFRLPVPDAPGLVFFGAEADPASLGRHNTGLPVGGFAGSGLNPQRAFESCVGEGIEYLSQFAQPGDPMEPGVISTFGESLDPIAYGFVHAVLFTCGISRDDAIDWIAVRRLPDGETGWLPADLCLRRTTPDFVPPLKLSTGCAAGVTPQAATLRGLLELIERDAVALWWRGGRRGGGIAPDSKAGQAAETLLEHIRRGRDSRQTMLLDITTDLGIPVVAAFSFSRKDGDGFALGLGARMDLAEAVRSAIFEMCQSELSLHVIAAKRRESGDTALNNSDQRQLTRAAALNPQHCLLLQPDDSVHRASVQLDGDSLQSITRKLAKHKIFAYTLDLTRLGFGVPVVRVVAPGLQSEPSEIATARLTRTIAETGGGNRHSGGIALL
jgi:ribosomal protein S12 methylthiotransferase accessory factor